MTKNDVATLVANDLSHSNPNVDKATAKQVIDSFSNTIKKAVAAGDSVTLRGLGTFGSQTRKAKVARNISKGEPMHIPAHQTPFFKPSADFREQIRTSVTVPVVDDSLPF